MSRARAVFSRRRHTQHQTTETPSSFPAEPAPPSAESQQVAQLARDVMETEGLAGEVTVNPWSGGYYVTLVSKGKDRTVYLFSLQNERSNIDVLRQAARDLKSVLSG